MPRCSVEYREGCSGRLTLARVHVSNSTSVELKYQQIEFKNFYSHGEISVSLQS